MSLQQVMKEHRYSLRMGVQSYANYMGIHFKTVKKIESGNDVQERVIYKLISKDKRFTKFLK